MREENKSVTRQIEGAREYAARNGWTIAEEHIYSDDGISGSEFQNRPGLMRLLNAAEPHGHRRAPFDALILSDLDRLGREQLETGYLLKKLSQSGVRVFTYVKGEVLLDSPSTTFLMQAQSFAETLEKHKAMQRTHDAMKRKAKAGQVTGGRVFGYDNVCSACGELVPAGKARCCRKEGHTERRINEPEAAVVREIYELCAQGWTFERRRRTSTSGTFSRQPRSRAARMPGHRRRSGKRCTGRSTAGRSCGRGPKNETPGGRCTRRTGRRPTGWACRLHTCEASQRSSRLAWTRGSRTGGRYISAAAAAVCGAVPRPRSRVGIC